MEDPNVRPWVVVKIGGELALDVGALAAGLCRAVQSLRNRGFRIAVVHGGGPQASSLSKELRLPVVQIEGQRVTDAATLEVVKMTVGGLVSVNVAAAFAQAGVPALCTTGVSASLVRCERRKPVSVASQAQPVDYGWVGDVTSVNTEAVAALEAAGFVPVLGCLASDGQGQVYNINADTVATRLAAQLGARHLFLVSNVPGVLLDRLNPLSRIPRLTPSAAAELIRTGAINGGMIPKVQESLAMLNQGVGSIHIVGATPGDALLREVDSPGSCGTAFVKEESA